MTQISKISMEKRPGNFAAKALDELLWNQQAFCSALLRTMLHPLRMVLPCIAALLESWAGLRLDFHVPALTAGSQSPHRRDQEAVFCEFTSSLQSKVKVQTAHVSR